MQNVAGVFLSIGSFDNHVRSSLPDRVSIGALPPTAAAVSFSGQSKCALTPDKPARRCALAAIPFVRQAG
jgi:hypothetical protein